MAARSGRDMTVEEFNRWCAAQSDVREVLEATAEEGGPRVSLVPDSTSVPLDFLPDAVQLPVPTRQAASAAEGTVVPSTPNRAARSSAAGTRCGSGSTSKRLPKPARCISRAKAAGLSARFAYALRVRSPAFSAAWDTAQQLAVGRLSALAFDRAIHGRIEQVYHQGTLVGEKRVPSERLLMWLLSRLDPKRFASPWERDKDAAADPQGQAQAAFPALLDGLTDVAEE